MSKEELEKLEREKYVVERKLTAAMHKEKRLFSSHILDVVEKLCNKISIIKDGRLLYSGTTEELIGVEGLEEAFMELNSNESFDPSIEK